MPMHPEPMNAPATASKATSRKPTTVLPPAAASAELSARPVRRKFTAQEKLRILAETDRVTQSGGVGAILRREGIYSSMLTEWRKLRDAGAIGALVAVKRGPKIAAPNPLAGELASLKREVARLTQRLACAETVIDIQKKVAVLLGMAPSDFGQRQRALTEAVVALSPASRQTAMACVAMGVSRASVLRRRAALRTLTVGPRPRARPARALTIPQTQAVLEVLHAPIFVDQAPAEIYATLLDQDIYHCSIRTMYRILSQNAEVCERRAQLRHPVYQKPELLAEAPNQVWSWDITKLMGPTKWTYFYLYVILDIFSRRVVGWCVAHAETAALFKPLFDDTVARHDVPAGQLTLHADRGGPMRAKVTAQLLADLGVVQSHSRPHTSNDNPFSESQFKNLKYQPQFPERFGCIEDARSFLRPYFEWYNGEHHHVGIGLMTPNQVHYGQADAIYAARQRTLDRACLHHPERFVNSAPKPPAKPMATWINPPPAKPILLSADVTKIGAEKVLQPNKP